MATKTLRKFKVVFPARIRFAIFCSQEIAWHVLSSKKFQTTPVWKRGKAFEVLSISEAYHTFNAREELETTRISIRMEGGFTLHLYISASVVGNTNHYTCDYATVKYFPLGSYSREGVEKNRVVFSDEELRKIFRPDEASRQALDWWDDSPMPAPTDMPPTGSDYSAYDWLIDRASAEGVMITCPHCLASYWSEDSHPAGTLCPVYGIDAEKPAQEELPGDNGFLVCSTHRQRYWHEDMCPVCEESEHA